jgi:hypothetical protein
LQASDLINISKSPPERSNGLWSDFKYFLFHKPDRPTLVKFKEKKDRMDYSMRIMQRLGIDTEQYSILNVHKIGVDVPAKYVFEELLKWDGDSTCWPNHLARMGRVDEQLSKLEFFFLGIEKMPFGLSDRISSFTIKPMFKLEALNFKLTPDLAGNDNARFLLYKCDGGYPIGYFAMYVRSSIERLQEKEQTQLFLIVGFNFYGKKYISKLKVIDQVWEWIHDRATANILNRIRQLCEWRFVKLQEG